MKRIILFLVILMMGVLSSCGDSTTQTPLMNDSTENPVRVTSSETSSPSDLPLTPTPTELPPSSTPTQTPSPSLIPMPLMGSEPHQPEQEAVLSLLDEVGAQIVRLYEVYWYKVEPQEGQYNWATLNDLDIALQELSARGIDVILIVSGTPDWAQKVPGSACGPITTDKFEAFANFMKALVQKYGASPYNVEYWELGNEPDVAPGLVAPDSVFGCWGDSQDPYYGGGYYAEMLKVVYPVIKTADPDAKILIGGLLLDCDPYNPPEGKDCLSSRFLNGILANQGADYFDIVSFHGYPPYYQQSMYLDTEYPGWEVRGGVVVGKINYLREVMGQYGIDKPLFLTESSLICPEWNQTECRPPGEHFYQTQADYVVRLFIRNWALDIDGTIWYDFEGKGWRYGGLVGEDPNNPKPAFQAFKFLNEKLAGMHYLSEAPLPAGIQGYIFSGEDHQTWVLWSVDESPQTIVLPQSSMSVYDKLGQAIAIDGEELTISSPIYIDVKP